MLRISALFTLLVASAILSGCAASMNEVAFSTDAPKSKLWHGFKRVARTNGFEENVAESDEGMGVFQSKWISFVSPFGLSKRRRLNATFEHTASANTSGWTIFYYIERQRVDDISKRFEVLEEDWSPAGQDRTREEIMLGQLRLTFGEELGIGPKYESWDNQDKK